jgi:HAMP domain-containing protein
MTLPAAASAANPARDSRWPVFDPRQSLRAQASLAFFAAAMAITLLSAWLGGAWVRADIERRAGRVLESLAVTIGERAELGLQERYHALQFAAGLPALHDRAQQRAVLGALLDAGRDFAWLGVLDAEGTITTAEPRLFEGERAAQRASFRIGSLEPWVGSLEAVPQLAASANQPESADAPFLEVAVPMRRQDGKPAGALVSYVRSAWLQEIARTVVPEALRREHLSATAYNEAGVPLIEVDAAGWTAAPALPSVPTGKRLRGTLIEPTAEGSVYLTGYYLTHGSDGLRGLRWFVTVREPIGEVFAPVHNFRRAMLRVGIVFSLVFGVAGWLSATSISRQLRRIAIAAQRIEAGDPLATLPAPSGEGEMARACRALRALIDHLRGR